MFRNILVTQVCFLLSLVNLSAADGTRDSSASIRQHKILIIPYEPRMHLSDADLDISEYSEITPPEVRAMMRNGFAEALNATLKSSYQTYSLMQDLRPESRQQLQRIYGSIDYSFDTSYAILHPRPDSAALKGRWNENKARKKELEKRTASGDVKYMNVKVFDPDLISSLCHTYNADMVVFLTQAEIKTHSRDCMDFQSQIYERDIKIHYSVFDSEGMQLYGDVASVRFPSNSNEIGTIMTKNFPVLSESIKSAVGGSN